MALLGDDKVHSVFNKEGNQAPRGEIRLDSHKSCTGLDDGHHGGYHLDAVVHHNSDAGRNE